VSDWEFRDPLFLIVGLAAPLVYWLAADLTLVDAAPRSQRARLAKLPALLLAAATLALVVALAGPRTGNATSRVHREGIAIAIAVDRSGSMQARDFVRGDTSVSRLEGAALQRELERVGRTTLWGWLFSPATRTACAR